MKLEIGAEVLRLAGVATPSKDLFINHMPIEVEQGVLLRDSYAGTPVHPYLPGYRVTGFTVAVRARDYAQAKALAWRVFDALTLRYETTVLGAQVKRMVASSEPRPYRRSVGAFHEFEIEVELTYVRPEA